MADPYLTLGKTAGLKLFYEFIYHPVISAAFPNLLDSAFFARSAEYFYIHKTYGGSYQLAHTAVLRKVVQGRKREVELKFFLYLSMAVHTSSNDFP